MEYWSVGQGRAVGGERRRALPSLQNSNTATLRSLLAFFLTVALQVLVRAPFARFQMIPQYLDFHPAAVLVPLAAVVFGPPGCWGSLAASVLGDRLMGPWGGITLFRAAGFFFFARSTLVLWNTTLQSHGDAVEPKATWTSTLRFVFAAWPACCAGGAWQALGSELLGAYPFTYVMTLLVLNNVLFCTMLGLPLYRLAARWWVQRAGWWGDALPAGSGAAPWLNAALAAGGAAGACIIGALVSSALYRVEVFQPFVLGSRTGVWVPLTVIPLLIVNAVGAFRGWGKTEPGPHRG